MARKGSKQRKVARAKRHRKELDGLIGRDLAEQVLAGTMAEGEAVITANLHESLGGRAFHLIHQLKK
jgi:hypothetical protein